MQFTYSLQTKVFALIKSFNIYWVPTFEVFGMQFTYSLQTKVCVLIESFYIYWVPTFEVIWGLVGTCLFISKIRKLATNFQAFWTSWYPVYVKSLWGQKRTKFQGRYLSEIAES